MFCQIYWFMCALCGLFRNTQKLSLSLCFYQENTRKTVHLMIDNFESMTESRHGNTTDFIKSGKINKMDCTIWL